MLVGLICDGCVRGSDVGSAVGCTLESAGRRIVCGCMAAAAAAGV